MGSTTRRVSESELNKLKEIQTHLKQIGIDISQVELSEAITNYVLERFDNFLVEFHHKREEKDVDPLQSWINTPVIGKEKTNSVQNHDVTSL